MRVVVASWRDQAVCREQTELMFRDDAEGIATAKALCGACPVADPCLEEAMAVHDQHGVWGGLTADERRLLRGVRKAMVKAKCGTRSGYVTHRQRGEEACEACRVANRAYVAQRREVERAISRDKAGSN